MGVYLNSPSAYTFFKREAAKPYFVDKSRMLEQLFPLVSEGNHDICITRPRRFGKTVMANMIAAFFSSTCDSKELFDLLAISNHQEYKKHLNKYSVIHISFNEMPMDCTTYDQYINRIAGRLISDLKREYPMVSIVENEAVWDALTDVFVWDPSVSFIFILDEWDFIFHQKFITEKDKKRYLSFLNNLLKDKPYALMAYMTGILPIAKYSSGSELNMFLEYTMVTEGWFSDDFGFTEKEVDLIFERYKKRIDNPGITREDLKLWYDGYHTYDGERVYNPRSVVASLTNNNLGNYWTSAGPYDEIFYYIENNVTEVRDDIAFMVSGIPVSAEIKEYAATSMNLQTKDEIFSAMVVYGFLSYEDQKELMDKFADMLKKEPALGYVHRLAKESARMLQATLSGDTKAMVEILEYAHDTEVPLLSYNNESDLTAVVNLVYLSARDSYCIEREQKSGIGYVDFIFFPRKSGDDGIILELKIGQTPDDAIRQIKEKKYALQFRGKLGGHRRHTGKILAVGITYDKRSKKRECKIEVLS